MESEQQEEDEDEDTQRWGGFCLFKLLNEPPDRSETEGAPPPPRDLQESNHLQSKLKPESNVIITCWSRYTARRRWRKCSGQVRSLTASSLHHDSAANDSEPKRISVNLSVSLRHRYVIIAQSPVYS